jgi:hypothetical protein
VEHHERKVEAVRVHRFGTVRASARTRVVRLG